MPAAGAKPIDAGPVAMNIILMTQVRLMGEGLASCIGRRPDMVVQAIVSDIATLRQALATTPTDLVLIDATQGVEVNDVRATVADHPGVAFVALGLTEQRQDVIQCGRAGFSGYIPREASIDALCETLADVAAGRLVCPAEISSGLFRALFRDSPATGPPASDQPLTRRESDVLRLIGEGLSNKEIARELILSVATVKHHVHHILDKLQLPRRAQAMRRVRDAPWLVSSNDVPRRRQANLK